MYPPLKLYQSLLFGALYSPTVTSAYSKALFTMKKTTGLTKSRIHIVGINLTWIQKAKIMNIIKLMLAYLNN